MTAWEAVRFRTEVTRPRIGRRLNTGDTHLNGPLRATKAKYETRKKVVAGE